MGSDTHEQVLLLAKAAQLIPEEGRAPLISRIGELLEGTVPADRALYDAVKSLFRAHPGCPTCECMPAPGQQLGIAAGGRPKRPSAVESAERNEKRRRLNRTQDGDFRAPILRVLAEQPAGRARSIDVKAQLEKTMTGQFTTDDLEWMANAGSERWWNSARWERKHMMLESPPLLNPGAPHGVWEITEDGRRYVDAE